MVQSSFFVSFNRICRALLIPAALLVAGCGSPEERAQRFYQHGMELLSQQDYVKASIELRNALQINNDLVGAWRGLAQIEEHNRNWESLLPIRRKIVELDPKDADAKLKLAEILTLGNALDEALKLVNAAAELKNRDPAVLSMKGAILFKLNDVKGAVREAEAALEIDPANAGAAIVLAAEKLARGDTEGALTILDRDAVSHANDVGVELFKIKIFEQAGKPEQVEAVLRKLVELYPREPVFRKQLVVLYTREKRLDEAEKELRAISAANSKDADAGLDVVRFLGATKGPAEARRELLSRITAGGDVFQYQMALAEIDFAQGNISDSIQLLQTLSRSTDSREHALAAQIKLAELHIARKQSDEAEALVTDVLRKDSRNAGGLKLRATLRLERGQLDAAIADARAALNDQPRSTDLMLLLAAAYERSGAIELAEKQYADATKVSGFAPAVSFNYVAFLRRRGSIARAEDVLTELANRWPNNVSVLSALAEIRLSQQNWIGAQEIADKIRRVGQGSGVSDQILVAALNGRNRYDESIKVLENVHSANPGAVQPIVALVNTLVRAGKIDRAIGFLQTILTSNSENAEAYVLLGSIQLLQNARDDALKNFQTAVERQPKNIVGYRALAEFYVSDKKFAEAEKIVQAALKEQPDSFVMRLILAGVFELKGDNEAAISEYESMLKQQPGSLVIANNLASMLADHRTDKASLERAYALSAALRKSQVPSFKDTVGWIYYLRGDYNGAISLLEEAAKELPDRAVVQYHLGMSYLAAGQLPKASERLKRARELAPDDGDLEAKIKAAREKAAI